MRIGRGLVSVRLLLLLTCIQATQCLHGAETSKPRGALRVATFNVALSGEFAGEMHDRLKDGSDRQATAVAAIIQHVDPDILLLNEFDYDDAKTLRIFLEEYVAVPQNGHGVENHPLHGVQFPFHFTAPVNTGIASGFDLDQDGQVSSEPGSGEYARDAWGYGRFPGQYGMVILSKHPINRAKVRTFQKFRWRDMPNALLPELPSKPGTGWYSDEVVEHFPLSSKSHWDVPIEIDGTEIHILACHPTPPVFDGPEDRNGRRNHDEIRFWADYLRPGQSGYIVDDRGAQGGLAPDARCLVLGDLNSDPEDGTDPRFPIRQLLDHERLRTSPAPQSAGAREMSRIQAGTNGEHKGSPENDTSDFDDIRGPGNLRLDYVLPSKDLSVLGSGVFWPAPSTAEFELVGDGDHVVSSDHRLVWVDVQIK